MRTSGGRVRVKPLRPERYCARHSSMRVAVSTPTASAGHPRHDERDAPPVRRRPPGMSCPVRQNHVTLALAGFRISLGAVVAYQRLSVGLREPFGLLAASEPSQHRRLMPACFSSSVQMAD